MSKPHPPSAPPSRTPPIALPRGDLASLLAIAFDGLLDDPRAAAALLGEVERAEVFEDDQPRAGLVRLGSRVVIHDRGRDLDRRLTLVAPEQADAGDNRISVLSPLGTGLIGLSEGQSILWSDRRGGAMELEVLQVLPATMEIDR